MPISLGQINFGLGADTTRLNQAITDIVRFGNQVTSAAQSTAAGANQVESALRRQEAAAISALQKVQRFQDAVGRLEAPQRLQDGLNRLSTRGLDQMVARMSSGQLTALQFQREMERFNVTMNNSQRILKNFSEAQRQAQANSMAENLRKLSGAATLIAGPLSGIATRISVLTTLSEHFSLAWAGAISGMAGAVYAFYNVSKAAIQVEKSLQQVQLALTAVYGNTTIANVQFKYLMDISDRTGTSFEVLAKQYSQIQAASKGTNLEGERTRKVFEAIVFAGAKLGLSSEEVKGSLVAVQQMMSKGTVSSEELRQQLGDRLPGAVQIMAAAVGVSTQKLQDMMKKGEIGASVLSKFADQLLKRYNVDTSQNIDTISAAEGRLTNARIRALDTLDKLVGFSDAYKAALNKLSEGINFLTTNARTVVTELVRVGTALAAAFVVPMALSGITTITTAVIGLSRAIATLELVSAASGLRSLLRLFAMATAGVAAYYGSQEMVNKLFADTKEALTTTTPAVEAYLEAQKKLISSDRGPTKEYIKQEQEKLDLLKKQRDEQAKALQAPFAKIQLAEGLGATQEQLDKLWKSMELGPKQNGLAKTDAAMEKTKKNIAGLNELLERQSKIEDNPKPDPTKDLTDRQILAGKKAEETIRNLRQQYNNLFLAPAAKEQAAVQEEITHKVEQFKESLERAKLPAGQLKDLVDRYAESLKKLKEGELVVKNQVSAFQALGGVFSRGVDQGLSAFIDVVVEGKNAFEAFGDTVKFIAKDILKTLLQLAALNPLKNFLFGMNQPVLGGSGGVGGWLGSLFSGGSGNSVGAITLGGPGGPTPFAMGGIMTSKGSKPLKRYRTGGIAKGSQFAEFGEGSTPEAYVPLPDGRSIPVTMNGGGNGGLEVHIHEAPGTKVTQQHGTNEKGQPRLDIVVEQLMRDAFGKDISAGGPMSQSIERQFGLNRAKGLS